MVWRREEGGSGRKSSARPARWPVQGRQGGVSTNGASPAHFPQRLLIVHPPAPLSPHPPTPSCPSPQCCCLASPKVVTSETASSPGWAINELTHRA